MKKYRILVYSIVVAMFFTSSSFVFAGTNEPLAIDAELSMRNNIILELNEYLIDNQDKVINTENSSFANENPIFLSKSIKATGKYALVKNFIKNNGLIDENGNKYIQDQQTTTNSKNEKISVLQTITYLESEAQFKFGYICTDSTGTSTIKMNIAENGSQTVTVNYNLDSLALSAAATFNVTEYTSYTSVAFKKTASFPLDDSKIQNVCNAELRTAFVGWDLLLLKYFDLDVNMANLGFISYEKPATHTWSNNWEVTKKASFMENGNISKKCRICGEIKESKMIAGVESPELSYTTTTYDGSKKIPQISIKDLNGMFLNNGTDYSVLDQNPSNVGKHKATVILKGNYTGTEDFYYTILPQKTAITKLKKGKKSFTVKWKKKTAQITGYQLRYSTKKSMKASKVVTISKAKTTTKTIKKLKAKKTYYVQIRTYKTVNGTKYYSAWSSKKRIKTK